MPSLSADVARLSGDARLSIFHQIFRDNTIELTLEAEAAKPLCDAFLSAFDTERDRYNNNLQAAAAAAGGAAAAAAGGAAGVVPAARPMVVRKIARRMQVATILLANREYILANTPAPVVGGAANLTRMADFLNGLVNPVAAVAAAEPEDPRTTAMRKARELYDMLDDLEERGPILDALLDHLEVVLLHDIFGVGVDLG